MSEELTKYERARIIGARALQVSQGAPLLVPNKGEMDPVRIAIKEFDAGKVPINVERPAH
ncbi:MAG TPA: DNA-directed RNA polymerase subunit K [Candidatus Nanoarchaeia archaeon]|nr:DNA-directed RNA polymerase subunit K [Candidatus Nanoarchaeia archaeon]